MKVQSVGNYDCQRKNDVSFKAAHIQGTGLKVPCQSNVYVERGLKDLLRNPFKFIADFAWTVTNGVIGRLTKAMSG